MKTRLFLATLFLSTFAIAQDRSLTVLEVSVIPRGADITITADGGCDFHVRIDPVADQKPARTRRAPVALCTPLKASMLRAAKLDQSVGSGAAP